MHSKNRNKILRDNCTNLLTSLIPLHYYFSFSDDVFDQKRDDEKDEHVAKSEKRRFKFNRLSYHMFFCMYLTLVVCFSVMQWIFMQYYACFRISVDFFFNKCKVQRNFAMSRRFVFRPNTKYSSFWTLLRLTKIMSESLGITARESS